MVRTRYLQCAVVVIVVSLGIGGSKETAAQTREIDSLETMLGQTKQDTNQVKVLLRLCDVHRGIDRAKAKQYGERALRSAQALSFPRGEVIAHALLGMVLLKTDPEAAKRHLETGLNNAPATMEARTIGLLYSGLGMYYDARNKYDSALSYQERAYSVYRLANDSTGMARALLRIGNVYYVRHDFDHAMEYYKKNYLLQERLKDKGGMASSLTNMGNVYKDQGKYIEALECFQRAMRLDQEGGQVDNSGTASTLNSIALTYQQLGRWDDAVSAHLQSLKLYETAHDTRGMCAACQNLGLVFRKIKNYTEALDYTLRALRLAQELGNTRSIGNLHHNLALIYEAQGDHEKARASFDSSLRIKERIGNKSDIASTLVGMGDLLRTHGAHDSAVVWYERGLQIYRETNDVEGMAGTLINMGTAKLEQGRYEEALQYYAPGLDLAITIGKKEWMKNAYEGLACVYAALRKNDDAYRCLKECAALKDTLYNEDRIKSINEMSAKYDSERREHEIQQLGNDNALKELELARHQERFRLSEIESERNRQRILLLERDRKISELDLLNAKSSLLLRTSMAESKEKQATYWKEMSDLNAELLGKSGRLRNALLAVLALLLLVAVLVYRWLLDKRREAMLRAQTAEYQSRAAELQARALKAETTALVSESERHRKEEMEQFAHKLIALQEQERARIARELHDSLGQELLIIKNQAHMAMQEEGHTEQMTARMQRVKDVSLEVLEEIRQLSRNLRPIQLERSGLSNTLREMLLQAGETAEVTVEAMVEDIDGLFAKEDEINVYRIIQESMTNVLKHADAKRVSVDVRRSNGEVRLLVRDDGRGFDAEALQRGAKPSCLGLQSMQERVQILKGRMSIISTAGAGTTIDVLLPVHQPETVLA